MAETRVKDFMQGIELILTEVHNGLPRRGHGASYNSISPFSSEDKKPSYRSVASSVSGIGKQYKWGVKAEAHFPECEDIEDIPTLEPVIEHYAFVSFGVGIPGSYLGNDFILESDDFETVSRVSKHKDFDNWFDKDLNVYVGKPLTEVVKEIAKEDFKTHKKHY